MFKSDRKLSGDHNQCQVCGEYFNSTRAFDWHRTGSYERGQRRCMTPAEMLKIGMAKNSGDWWVTSLRDYADSSPVSVAEAVSTDSQATPVA